MPTASFLHPAPLPAQPSYPDLPPSSGNKAVPPKPILRIATASHAIVLGWNMLMNTDTHADIASYQLFAYQVGSEPASTSLWKMVAIGKAIPLPMTCVLTQFMEEQDKYYFAIRAVDTFNRSGPFSDPVNVAGNHAATPVGKPMHFRPVKP